MSKSVLFYSAFFLIFLSSKCHCQIDGVLNKIKTGLEYASSYLETAREIADLVSGSFGHEKQKRGDEGGTQNESKPSGLISAFFRLLGLDSSKISAIAVNSAIFLAQMISSLLNLTPLIVRARSLEDAKMPEDPMKMIINSKNERIQNLVEQAQNADLPDRLIERVDGLGTSCIQLLLCKTSPIIWAAQRSLRNNNGAAKRSITWWLPSREEFEENAEKCEGNHTTCRLFPGS